MKALWNGKVLAESRDIVVLENNLYFPENSLKKEFFKESPTHTTCPWKGEASYYDIEVDQQINKDAAWTYHDPSVAASSIKDRVAFWKGIQFVND